MSRKSENSRAGSAGDGGSMVSSYETTPRKSPGTSGAFGDHSTTKKSSSFIIYEVDSTNSSDSEDQESHELKVEYLQRLRLIREKLASIDIANRSYYSNCFGYPPDPQNQCTITEIADDEFSNSNEMNDINNTKSVFVTNCNINDKIEIVKHKEDNSILEMHEVSEISKECDRKINSTDSLSDLNSTTSLNLNEVKQDPSPISEVNSHNLTVDHNTNKESDFEIKTILNYGSSYNTESSSMELLDLNYNPPKKKPCIRENTPKMALSESTISLPRHTRVNLHDDITKVNKKALETEKQSEEFEEAKTVFQSENIGEINNYTRPQIQFESVDDSDQIKTNNIDSCDKIAFDEDPDSPRKSVGKDNLYVLFLDTLEDQSPSSSSKSNRSIVTETTVTIESSPRKPKKRRVLLRSARNKIKPVDHISLWEEIRTMDAMNRRKRQDSANSKEIFFQNILLNKTEEKQEIDLTRVGSLDIPRKISRTARFPSITKITKFCSSAFSKKSESTMEDKSDHEVKPIQDGTPEHVTEHQNKNFIPKVANTLLNLRKEQDFYLENDQYTPSCEAHSDYSVPEDDVDAYYQPYCLFCFCF